MVHEAFVFHVPCFLTIAGWLVSHDTCWPDFTARVSLP